MKTFSKYTPDDFTRDGVLKMSPLLWIILLYLSRHLLVLILGGLSVFMSSRRGIDVSGLSVLYSSPLFIAASLPALLIVVAHFRRVPSAGGVIRAIWRRGRWLLGIAAVLDLLLLLGHWGLGWLQVNQYQIAGAFLDAYVMSYLLRSVRARDTFEDFPEPQPDN